MWHSWLPIFALFLGLVPVAFGDDASCFPTGNCYTLNNHRLTFDKAKMACGFKGFLISMKTQQEKKEILNLVTQFQDQRNISIFWLGLYLPTCVSTAKNLYGFVWVSGGDTSEVTEWNNTPKPSCTTKRKCVILEIKKYTSSIGSSDVSLIWRDVRCNQKFPSICRSSESMHISTTKEIEVVTQSSTDQYRIYTSHTDQYTTHTSFTAQHTEKSSSASQINVPCRGLWKNVTSSCTVSISYVCNVTHCSCGNMNDSRVLYSHRRCKVATNMTCLQQCIKSMDISCSCNDDHTLCEGEECKNDLPSSPESPVFLSTDLHSASSTSAPPSDDDNILDGLITPLILGLVAFGILVMLVWGGVQMCIRKRKPKRRKSIAPAPPEGSDTDSTEHSSSEEEEDDEEEGESQDRTEDP